MNSNKKKKNDDNDLGDGKDDVDKERRGGEKKMRGGKKIVMGKMMLTWCPLQTKRASIILKMFSTILIHTSGG